MPRRRASRFRKHATLIGLLAAVAVMVTLVSYSVTLYRLFCSATGALGTTQRVTAAAALPETSARAVTVRFLTSTAPDLPWRFAPVQNSVRVHLGQETLVFFEAENLSDAPIVGHATFNVSPGKTGKFFNKIQCFCFTEERLEPHQKVEMPVDFYVDPKMAADPNTEDVTEIDLSYTFFRSRNPDGAEDLARFVAAPGSAEAGQKLFATACAECHALDHNKVGPALAGVVGRPAGTAPGFPYSPALASSGLVWTKANLEKWLSGPQAMVPGARMPVALPDPESRAAVIAYLASVKAAPAAAAQARQAAGL
ncbi:MAG TPA: cytochrome c oxidase assembly protein [Acetobacteraceae bacterium]|nr:cytochrome c oxidase assembly protein [Acetobacteraceae bacterium]